MRFFSIFWLCFTFLSCGNQYEVDDSKVFRFNRYDNITSLDPAFARSQPNNWACNLLYNSLVKLDDSLNIQPDIARKWVVSEDGLTYQFILRKKVFFHPHPVFGKDSTRRVTAEDFVYSFNRLTDEKVGGAGSWVMNQVESYQALSDSVFQIKLKDKFPPFLGLLSMKYCSVVPKEMFDNGSANFQQHPIGTGPFRFMFWEENVKLVLGKNPLYFEKDEKGNSLPYLESVAITFLPEKQSEFLQLVQGKVDMVADLDPSYKDEVLTPNGELNPKYADTFNMDKYPYLSTIYLCFFLEGKDRLDERIRKAIGHAIDKEKMIKYLMNGVGTAANGGFIPKGLPGYQPNIGYDFQPEKALELVKNYKKEKGNLPTITLQIVSEYADLAEFIQAQCAKIGLSIQVNVMQGPPFKEAKANGKLPFFRANWGADYPDEENFLSLFYSPNFAPDGPNYSHFSKEAFDQLYEYSLTIVDESERRQSYQKMDELIMQNAPVLPLFYDETILFVRKNVKNLSMSPVKLLDLSRVYKEKRN